MPIVIREIVTEVVVRGGDEAGTAVAAGTATATAAEDAEARADVLVRRAVERVLELLRREWER